MKIAITAAALSLALAFSAGAAEYHGVAGKQLSPASTLFACERGPVSRVALAAPAHCCAGQMVCSQFLSTSSMVRGAVDART